MTFYYSSVEAPPKRGFSSIEAWFIGMQAPTLLAVLEYGMMLGIKRFVQKPDQINYEKLFKSMDLISLVLCVIYFIFFNIIYFSYY